MSFQERKAALRSASIDAGHTKRALSKVIRARCLDCCCGQAAEVRRCEVTSCPSWPYRFGTNPFFGKRLIGGQDD